MNKKRVIVGILCILVLVIGFFAYNFYGPMKYASITSFDECQKAGLPVMESFPARCSTPDGRTFTQKLSPEEQLRSTPAQQVCQNKCGDNVCQEIVCMGSGCPCAETTTSCPADCSK